MLLSRSLFLYAEKMLEGCDRKITEIILKLCENVEKIHVI